MKRISLLAWTLFLALAAPLRADDAIASAQQALKEQGFYYGEINGRKDADTIAAIRRYQIRNGLKITGELNTETERSLRITRSPAPTNVPQPPSNAPANSREEVSPPRYSPRRDVAPPMYAPEPYRYGRETGGIFAGTPYETASPGVQQRIIADAQVFLARRGYYRSGIDGLYGPGTEFALRAFQSRIGLPLTGRFDTPTLRALGLAPGRQYRRPFRSFPPRVPRPVYRGEWIPD